MPGPAAPPGLEAPAAREPRKEPTDSFQALFEDRHQAWTAAAEGRAEEGHEEPLPVDDLEATEPPAGGVPPAVAVEATEPDPCHAEAGEHEPQAVELSDDRPPPKPVEVCPPGPGIGVSEDTPEPEPPAPAPEPAVVPVIAPPVVAAAAPEPTPLPPQAAPAPAQAPASPAPGPAATVETTAPERAMPSEPAPSTPQVTAAPEQALTDSATSADGSPGNGQQHQQQGREQPQPQSSGTPSAIQPAAPPPSAAARPAADPHVVPVRFAPAEVAQVVIDLAAKPGSAAKARIALRPAELGGVEVRLHSGDDGVNVQILAETHEAAEAMRRAGNELRSALEAQGLTVLGLDIAFDHDERPRTGWAADDRAGRAWRGDDEASWDESPEPEAETTHARLAAGVLVDVLA